MSTSSPVRTRQPRRPSLPSQAGSNRSPRGEAVVIVVRSILLVVAAVSVIATSNYFAYLIGRKQVTYEELRKQVDRVVQLMDQKRAEEELAPTTLKQRQERLEQNASGLTGLTTSTINGKTVVREPAPAERPIAAALIDDTAIVPPDHEVRLQPPEPSLNATTKHRGRGVAYQRGPRRQKVSPTSPRRGPTEPAIAEQSGQLTTAIPATPDAGLARQ
ncbi:MAG: hypothetical protein WCC81_02035 [Pseudolabrys sp.]|jgi:hypothetical protein